MKHNKHDVKKTMIDLGRNQKKHKDHFPERETLSVYDWQCDVEYNEDFALWEMQMGNK